MNHTCYKCDEPATSKEHVPPRCLFPKQKDSIAKLNLRKNLITVPSCDMHNSHKSKDDEYLFFVLVSTVNGNKVSSNLFQKTLIRAFQRKPHVYKSFFTPNKEIFLQNDQGIFQKTLGINIDVPRFNRIIEQVASALLFHHYQTKWISGHVRVLSNILLDTTTQEMETINRTIASGTERIKNTVHYLKATGENSLVFEYKAARTSGQYMFVMSFYGGIQVAVMLDSV